MAKFMMKVAVLRCIACHSTKCTLRKIKGDDARICEDCLKWLRAGKGPIVAPTGNYKTIMTPDGLLDLVKIEGDK